MLRETSNLQYLIVASLCCLVLVRFQALSEVPIDSGDGLAHFYIAQHVWKNPIELLNHWGKPLFTLLSSPWAYFGYAAYVAFNVVIYAATLLTAFFIGKRLKFQSSLILIFPIALLTSMDYTGNILGGMTEVLFGFLVLLSALFILQKRWIWFALLISIAPFSRSEGQILIPLAAIILLICKQWKVLPFLFTGFLVYATIGHFALGDFWWYFNQNPYTGAEEIYGHGTWMHYINYWYIHLGFIGLTMLIFGLTAFVYLNFKKRLGFEKNLVILYLSLVYFGILIVHIYLWAHGKSGALGLTRLAVHGWPGLLLVCLYCVDSIITRNTIKMVFSGLVIFASGWIIYDFPWVYEQPFPRKAQPDERAVLEAAHYANQLVLSGEVKKVYYYHPLVSYAVGANLKDTTGVYIQQSFYQFESVYNKITKDDLIILDSHFGHRDMNFPEDRVSDFEVTMSFTPLNQYVHQGNSVAQVKVLKIKSNDIQPSKLKEKKLLEETVYVYKDTLYQNLMLLETASFERDNLKIRITVNAKQDLPEEKLFLVIQESNSGQGITFEIAPKNVWEFSLHKSQGQSFKFFFHNPHQVEGNFKLSIEEREF